MSRADQGPAGQFNAPFVFATGEGEISSRRLALLAAIGRLGSISAAAREIGITYKAAWDAVEAINNLSDSPLVTVQHGGKGGGGAALTSAGRALADTWQTLGRLQRAWLDSLELPAHAPDSMALIRRLTMRSSARNTLHGVVEQVRHGSVNSEISIRLAGGDCIHAVITRDSAEALDLAPGRETLALIKASWVVLASDAGGESRVRTSARNELRGKVIRVVVGEVDAEVTLALKGGNTLAAVVTHQSIQDLDLREGVEALALIKASHVILGVQS